MAEFPAMPLWTDAYLGDTTHLTTTEHGAYFLLLIIAWRAPGCRLPDDDVLLARYARMTRDKWRKARPVLEPFFTIRDGFWNQARQQDEFRHLQSRREQQIKAGNASAKAKLLKRNNRGATSVGDTLQQNDNEQATPTPIPNTLDKSNGGKPPDPVKELFDLGVALLVEAGSTEKQARSLIGKWRKSKPDADVLQGLLDCRARSISEPIEWLEKRFKGAAYISKSGYEYRGDREAVMRQAHKRADWDTYWQVQADINSEKVN